MANMLASVNLVEAALAVAHSGQRISSNFGERHQVVRLLPNLVVGVRELGRELERRLEHSLSFLAKLLPGGFGVLFAQVHHPVLEPHDAGMVRGQMAPHELRDLFEFLGDSLRPFQFATGLRFAVVDQPAAPIADQIPDHRHGRQRDRCGKLDRTDIEVRQQRSELHESRVHSRYL